MCISLQVPVPFLNLATMTGGTMSWTRRSKLWRHQHTSYGRTLIGWYMTATHTQIPWVLLHLQHQNCCKVVFTMSFITVLRGNMGRNIRLISWIRAVNFNDNMELHPISNSCNKFTLSLTFLDCYLSITVCIHRKYGSKVYRIAEHFGLFSNLPGSTMVWILRDGRSVPSTES